MTQTPLPPSNPPPEPLDADERELARALRNLPAGTPSPELDARILGAARRAVHLAQPRRRSQGWLIGLGTAATALLAVGLFVKMQGPGGTAAFPPPADTISEAPLHTAMPRPEAQAAKEQAAPVTTDSAAAPAAAAQLAEKPAPADLEKAKAAEPAAANNGAPVMQSAPTVADGIQSSPSTHPIAARQVPNAFPAAPSPMRAMPPPPPPPEPIVTRTPMSTPAPMAAPPLPAAPAVEEQDERRADSGFAARRDEPAAATSAPVAAGVLDKDENRVQDLKKAAPTGQAGSSNGPASGGEAAKSLDRLQVEGSRVKRETEHARDDTLAGKLPASIDDDAALPPAQWLERIRARMTAADTDRARASLRRFHDNHPDIAIPSDLQTLLP